ncbi:MAG: hypothetical protein M3Q24_00565 [bacterium]|nr:hypothetical protein [bacterium]
MEIARDDFFTSEEPLPVGGWERTTSGLIKGEVHPLEQKNSKPLSGKMILFNSLPIDRGEGPESEAEMELGGMTSPLMEDATGCANKKEEIEFFKSFL